ncbi:MAG: hypothetical protein VKI83_12560 [Synechococcaceae cyanobacterium]|nr:hypothetical protein [Synechococcaceae cyanobacterium]
MSFDAHSRERLEALGRQLPRQLPAPPPAPTPTAHPPQQRLHRLEREQDPAQLFRALMDASADGSVPPHLMMRLRELESAISDPAPRQDALSSSPAARDAPSPPGRRQRAQRTRQRLQGSLAGSRSGEDQSLYSAFRQLLDEDDD